MKLLEAILGVAHFVARPQTLPPEIKQAHESAERVVRASNDLVEKQDIFADLVQGLKGATLNGSKR